MPGNSHGSAALVAPESNDVGKRARRRIASHLLPFVFLMYVVNYTDRVNVSFANLSHRRTLERQKARGTPLSRSPRFRGTINPYWRRTGLWSLVPLLLFAFALRTKTTLVA